MDLIDRQAAIDAFNTGLNELVVGGEENVKTVENYLNRVIKTIKCLPSAADVPDTNVGELISRQAAIEVVQNRHMMLSKEKTLLIDDLENLPPAQPEIIYCKDCAKHNKGLGNYEVHPDGSSTWIWKDSACPLVSWRGKAQGHEYDYQYCVYAERKETE